MEKMNKLLLKILLLSFLIFLLSIKFSNKERRQQKSVVSAILNPSHKNEIDLIEINEIGSDEKMVLKNQGEFCVLFRERICTIADSKIISTFLENAVKIRKIYEVTGKEEKYGEFGVAGEEIYEERKAEDSNDAPKIDGERFYSVSFFKNRENICAKLYFGRSNSLKNRIYIRSENSKIIYETENDFRQFLTTDIAYWADGEIFPEIRNAVQVKFSKKDGYSKILDEKSENFASSAYTLLSLRHGKIFFEPNLERNAISWRDD